MLHRNFSYSGQYGPVGLSHRQTCLVENKFSSIFTLLASIKLFPIILIFIIIFGIPYFSFSEQEATNSTQCNCVAFRMDDIQDYWIKDGQTAPMNIFLSKNKPLTLGLIMNHVGDDLDIVNAIRNGSDKGLFELAIHGWDHVEYTTLNEKEQRDLIYKSNDKMNKLFGNRSDIFIPPNSVFNNATLGVMGQQGFRIISSNLENEQNFNQGKDVLNAKTQTDNKSRQKIYHLPSTVSYSNFTEDNQRIKNPIKNILDSVIQSIGTYGYSVVLLHPQDFMKLDMNGNLTDTLDENEIKDLSRLIDLIFSRNINITSFSKIVGIEPKVYTSIKPSMDNSMLEASDRIPLEGLKELEGGMANIYNEYGKYIYQKGSELGISPSAAAAVIYVESSGSGFGTDGRMTIRFEACTFYDLWGKENAAEFSKYFQCNKPNDKFRTTPTDEFRDYHGNHFKEWEAFELAQNLDEDSALKSISMGLAQIMGFNYDKIGYPSVKEMYDKMSQNVKSQLDALFSALSYRDGKGTSCLDGLKSSDYVAFARCYNAAGQDERYASEIESALRAYEAVTIGKKY